MATNEKPAKLVVGVSETSSNNPPPDGEAGDLNLAIVRPLLAYVEKKFGRDGLTQLSDATGLDVGILLRPQIWVPLEQIETLFATARSMLSSDAQFVEACGYEIVKSYGPMAILLRAATVGLCYRVLASTTHFASHISTYRLTESRARSVVLEYTSTKKESRLMCLSRQAQLPTIPLMWWGLAPAKLVEKSCIAHGADRCTYALSWTEPLAIRWPLAGVLAGLVAMFGFGHYGVRNLELLPVLAGLFGAAIAFRRMVVQARQFHQETTDSVMKLFTEHEEAITEITALHMRQEGFNALLAERIEARTSALRQVLAEVGTIRARSETALRGLSHDLNNPLQVIHINNQILAEHPDPEVKDIGTTMIQATDRLEAQMKRLVQVASANTAAFDLHNERLDVVALVERIRKHLAALVLGRDIRVSAFRTREAPDSVETDVLLFDRVIDNLLSNAVKYTERGSIVVEVGGIVDHLVIKVSDTGRGIASERLEKVFIGGQRDPNPLLGESHGVGLSNTVRLLDELGGRLEVMSKPNVGTTIWANLPIVPNVRDKAYAASDVREVVARVVTIRKAANS